MSRWLAIFLAVIAGAIGAWAATLFIAGGLYGVLWIFIFGDDSWPAWVDPLFGVAMVGLGLGLWLYFARAVFSRLSSI